jgi:copper chaperone
MEEEQLRMTQVQETVLSVPEVSCEHCVKTINSALGQLRGVESVSTDIPSKTVQLRYDPAQVSMDTIEATLDDAGYTVAK